MKTGRLVGVAVLSLAACVLVFTTVRGQFADWLSPEQLTDLFSEDTGSELPEVVAEVNGEPFSGRALAIRMKIAELNQQMGRPSPEGQAETLFIDLMIQQVLLEQAAHRLGVAVSYEEAREFTERQEQLASQLPPERYEAALDWMEAQGFPRENWASDRRLVELNEKEMNAGRTRKYIAEQLGMGPFVDPVALEEAVSQFVVQERQQADIWIHPDFATRAE